MGVRRTVGLFSVLFIILPIFFPFVYPFGDTERTLVLCCIDGSDVSGNVPVGAGNMKLLEPKIMN